MLSNYQILWGGIGLKDRFKPFVQECDTFRKRIREPYRNPKSGFTMVEIIVAMSIFIMVVALAIPMYIQSSRRILTADSKLDISDEIRNLNNNIISEAREADAFILYDNFRGAWIDDDFVNFRNEIYSGQGRLRDGNTGKFLLLLFYGEDLHPDDRIPAPIDRMVGMYLDASENEVTGALKYFNKTSIDNSLCLEENIPAISTSSDHKIIMNEMTGLMDGDIFYNFSGRSVMINAKIEHENGAIKESNTYNFTITPR